MIAVGQPIVLKVLRHAEDCSIPGFEGKKGEPVVLPAPKTDEQVKILLGVRRQALAAGWAVRKAFGG